MQKIKNGISFIIKIKRYTYLRKYNLKLRYVKSFQMQ